MPENYSCPKCGGLCSLFKKIPGRTDARYQLQCDACGGEGTAAAAMSRLLTGRWVVGYFEK